MGSRRGSRSLRMGSVNPPSTRAPPEVLPRLAARLAAMPQRAVPQPFAVSSTTILGPSSPLSLAQLEARPSQSARAKPTTQPLHRTRTRRHEAALNDRPSAAASLHVVFHYATPPVNPVPPLPASEKTAASVTRRAQAPSQCAPHLNHPSPRCLAAFLFLFLFLFLSPFSILSAVSHPLTSSSAPSRWRLRPGTRSSTSPL